MSFRNDHDAAIARVDALELELEHMAGEYEKTRMALAAKPTPPTRSWRGPIAAMVLAVGTVGAGAGMAFTRSEPGTPEAPVAAMPAAVEVIGSADLWTCLAAVEASMRIPATFTADSMDPRSSSRSTSELAPIGASCRPELARRASDVTLGAETHAALTRWLAAEDQLSNRISLITEYYASNPHAVDGYESAGQLWREFASARSARDEVIDTSGSVLRRAASAL